LMIIMYQKTQQQQEEKKSLERLVEIYKKDDKTIDKTAKEYVKKINKAEDELVKIKKETNYKNYNSKTSKEKEKDNKETRERIYDISKDEDIKDDLIMVRGVIEKREGVDTPKIII